MSDQNNEENKNSTSTDDANKNAQNATDNTNSAKSTKQNTSEGNKSASESEFSKEYVHELRAENKTWRLKTKELEDKLKALEEDKNNQNTQTNKSQYDEEAKKAAEEAADLAKKAFEKSNKLQSAIEKRLINAELQQLAAKEGLIDMDAFKMVDISSVKISEEGEVVGLDKIMEDLKANKPYLFKLSSNSNQNVKTPQPTDDKNKRPVYKDTAEFEKAAQNYLSSLR